MQIFFYCVLGIRLEIDTPVFIASIDYVVSDIGVSCRNKKLSKATVDKYILLQHTSKQIKWLASQKKSFVTFPIVALNGFFDSSHRQLLLCRRCIMINVLYDNNYDE